MNLANFFTCLRVMLIPVFMLVYYSDFRGHHLTASAIFIVACITDWLDGHTARRLKQTSRFGAFLDPVADKLLVAISLVMLAASYPSPWYVIPANYKWFRDLAISEIVKNTLEDMSMRWPKPSIEVETARRALKKLK